MKVALFLTLLFCLLVLSSTVEVRDLLEDGRLCDRNDLALCLSGNGGQIKLKPKAFQYTPAELLAAIPNRIAHYKISFDVS